MRGDGSTDNAFDVATRAGATVIKSHKNMGNRFAIRALFYAAGDQGADIMVTLDSDGQHNPDQIPRVIEPLLSLKLDIVIGSRFLSKDDKENSQV